MKKMRKIALSGIALAATAATLGTTTFAWYTTNTTVSASGLKASSASTGDSSIFISKTGGESTWSQGVSFTAESNKYYTAISYRDYILGIADLEEAEDEPAATDVLETSTVTSTSKDEDLKNKYVKYSAFAGMKPVQLMSDGSFVAMSKTGTVDTGTDVSGYLFTTTLYFKTSVTSANVNVYLENYRLQNAAASLTATDNLLLNKDKANGGTTTTGSPAKTSRTYAVDIVNALGMLTVEQTGVPSGENTYTAIDLSAGGTASTSANDATTGCVYLASTGFSNGESGIDALKYYNKVMGTSIAAPDSAALSYVANKSAEGYQIPATTATLATADFRSGSRTKIATLDKDGGTTRVDFTIFLNGWDTYCFDVCKGQTFVINFNFTSDNTAAN